jgi:hypothetical protein
MDERFNTPETDSNLPASPCGRVALLWRGKPGASPPDPKATPLRAIFAALADLNIVAEPVVYADEAVDLVRDRLLGFDGVMVWVNPIADGEDRSRLDPMLRDLAAQGLWVSAHPDVILKMGVKAVLHRTRELGWGVDTHLYETAEQFKAEFPARLADAGTRVLKQNRGNGGIGVWKVQQAAADAAGERRVSVLDARRDHADDPILLTAFMDRCEVYFADSGRLIDQAHQARVGEGMVRCYLSQSTVVGFSEQFPRSLSLKAVDPAAATFGMASGKTMHDQEAPRFQGLRRLMETDWVPGLQRLLQIDTASLPALWDADFLYGPKAASGGDTFVLCEINVSAVSPFPETAAGKVAIAVARMLAAKSSRPVS